jgi:REP-associated tyrosine transposase
MAAPPRGNADLSNFAASPPGTEFVVHSVMSQPRQIIPGSTYLLTRRALRRHLLFRPDAPITQLITYALAVSARRFGVEVHALCAMSTHVHIVVTDVKGVLPSFLRNFHRLVALGVKVLRAWEGPVWGHEATSVVRLATREAVLAKMVYTLVNPVAAGLVARAQDWPGAKVRVADIGRGVLRAARPGFYFDPANPAWPDVADLRITLPPGIEAWKAKAFRRQVAAEVAREEAKARAERSSRGAPVPGAARVLEVSPFDRASSLEAFGERNPTFAVGRGNMDAWRCAAGALRAFRSAYRSALDRWRTGLRSVVFPAGTWWMRVLHAVAVCVANPLS